MNTRLGQRETGQRGFGGDVFSNVAEPCAVAPGPFLVSMEMSFARSLRSMKTQRMRLATGDSLVCRACCSGHHRSRSRQKTADTKLLWSTPSKARRTANTHARFHALCAARWPMLLSNDDANAGTAVGSAALSGEAKASSGSHTGNLDDSSC